MTEMMETTRETRAIITRSILFSAPMVRAILTGKKTQTRRAMRYQPSSRAVNPPVLDASGGRFRPTWQDAGAWPNPGRLIKCPFGVPGDRLWVRETWSPILRGDGADGWENMIRYAADGCEREVPLEHTGWFDARTAHGYHNRPSIHMPRWASRITLEITGVRVERLQGISDADSHAEGCATAATAARSHFRNLWESINGPGSWAANPWVWVIEFRPFQPSVEKKR